MKESTKNLDIELYLYISNISVKSVLVQVLVKSGSFRIESPSCEKPTFTWGKGPKTDYKKAWELCLARLNDIVDDPPDRDRPAL